MAQGQDVQPRAAASVILMREGARAVEIYLLRRHRNASFMSSSYVFPGGIAEEGEDDLRLTAARELFEEAGVLLAEGSNEAQREAWRHTLNVDKQPFAQTLGQRPLQLETMQYYAHWITPSVEKRRYSAQFFMATMPKGQVASPDNRETVDEVWVSPEEALERATELHLPPPQLRTFFELVEPSKAGIAGMLAFARKGQAHAHAILPRACASAEGLTLLMPWDAEYLSAGNGASLPMAADHPLAWGPSRFVLQAGGGWKHIAGPSAGPSAA